MTNKNSILPVYQALNNLTLCQDIINDPVVNDFNRLLSLVIQEPKTDMVSILSCYNRLAGALLEASLKQNLPPVGNLWQNHILNLLLHNGNTFARTTAARKEIQPVLQEAFLHDLVNLQCVCHQGLAAMDELLQGIPGVFSLSRPVSEHNDNKKNNPVAKLAFELKQDLLNSTSWEQYIDNLVNFIQRAGYREFISYWAFRWEEGEAGYKLSGIEEPDPIRLDQLIGYERQRKQVIDNTERLLKGQPAHNLLLYGDRGTGKSSTVKALLHQYGFMGLRLVQVSRKNLDGLQSLTRYLRTLPLKFIIFIDDLSFEETETDYKEFKTQLEGSLEQQPNNVCIYVTSNLRNLVKENFSERTTKIGAGGDVHPGDTMQEKLSLTDRFGLKITFMAPDKQTFLEIVRKLALLENIDVDASTLEKLALQWILWNNERSGRTARQFIDHIKDRDNLDIF